ncbi:hypothetical protein E2C01_073505 [Portunus trituberculatus]|uniref:Uncharacterized protein n=1 Tax=Portunus trituberculatus TaxID=210409 RepID=A0A5B7IE39_PORTR|nr:hypothetical protein [Portunus trituberculatus]
MVREERDGELSLIACLLCLDSTSSRVAGLMACQEVLAKGNQKREWNKSSLSLVTVPKYI